MANIFKLKTKANVSNSTADTIYTVPALTTSVVIGLVLANKTSHVVTATVDLNSTTNDNELNTAVTLFNNISIPDKSTLEVFGGQKMIMQTTDQIKVLSDTYNGLDVALSILEIS
jgi:hypothetical protein